MLHNFRFYGILLALAMACLLGISKAAPRIAKPGCVDHCGNVSIPYPFGIGPKCYHNPSFNVECNQGSDSFILKETPDRIDGIQINFDKGERTLISPVPCYRICGGDGSPRTLVFGNSNNLTRTPFLFSRKSNVLLVNSCGAAIILRDKNNNPIGGCGAVCNNNGTTPGLDCYGVNCCQSTISNSVDLYSLEVDSIGSNRVIGDECTRAVLVDSNWIVNKKKNLMHFQGLCDPAHVVLEWSVKDLPINSPSYANSTCFFKSPSADDAGGFVCRCKKPFYQGNPYLPYGCQ